MKTSDVVVDKEKRCLGRRVISLVMLVIFMCTLVPNEGQCATQHQELHKLEGSDR